MARRRGSDRTPFADALRRYRLAAGLSQADLARRARTSPSLIAFLELGQRQPRRDKVLALARALTLAPAERDSLLRKAGLVPIASEHVPDPSPLGQVIADLRTDSRLSLRQRLIAESLIETFALWLRDALAKEEGTSLGRLVKATRR